MKNIYNYDKTKDRWQVMVKGKILVEFRHRQECTEWINSK